MHAALILPYIRRFIEINMGFVEEIWLQKISSKPQFMQL